MGKLGKVGGKVLICTGGGEWVEICTEIYARISLGNTRSFAHVFH